MKKNNYKGWKIDENKNMETLEGYFQAEYLNDFFTITMESDWYREGIKEHPYWYRYKNKEDVYKDLLKEIDYFWQHFRRNEDDKN